MAKEKEAVLIVLPDMEGPNIICAHSDDDEKTLPNFRKHPRRGRKETRGKDKSPGKQTAQQRWATRGKGTTKNSCYCKSTKVSPASFLFLT